MKFKLDENLDPSLAELLAKLGHDGSTVIAQGIGGTDDETLFRICEAEERILVTLDLDFSNPLRFHPSGRTAIIVLRPGKPLLAAIRLSFIRALEEMKTRSVLGKLWIVEPTRLRIHSFPDDLP